MDARKVATIAWHEYFTNVRRVGFIFVTLLFPALSLLGLLIIGLFSGQVARFAASQLLPAEKPAGIVDEARLVTPIASEFAENFVAFPDENAARRALLADEVYAYFVISRDYVATGKVTWYTKSLFSGSASSGEKNGTVSGLLVHGLLAGKVDAATLTRVLAPTKFDLITLDSRGEAQANAAVSFLSGFLAPYIFSILMFISVFASSNYLLRSVSEEKETRVIEILLSSVSPTELLAGKVIGLGALGLTQVGVWIGSGFGLSGGLGVLATGVVFVLNPGTFLLAAVFFVLGYLMFGTLMATAGSLGTSMRESQQIAGIFSSIAAVPWLFIGVLFTNPNGLLLRVLSFFPLTAPTMMMLRLPMTQVPMVDIAISLGVLFVSIPLTLWGGAKIFRIGLLMYGKRPSLAEIWRAVRTA